MTCPDRKKSRILSRSLKLGALIMLGTTLYTPFAHAQQLELGKIQGMQHMTITPDKSPAAPQQNTTRPEPQNTEPEQTESYKPLDMDETLVQTEDLQTWSDMSLAASAHTKKELAQLQYNIEQNRGVVPPQGLFIAAQSFAQAGQMQQAGLYYILGQLRLEFDRARWPMHRTKGSIEKEKANARKTEDQALPNAAEPEMYNPHRHVEALDSTIGPPIFSWLVKDPSRLKLALDMAEKWDAATPYAYDPGYKAEKETPFKDWPKLLKHSRAEYFIRMRSLQQNLARYVGK